VWSAPVEVEYRGTRFLTRSGLSELPETLPRLPTFRGASPAARVLGLLDALGTPEVDLPEHTRTATSAC
jgi:hypothetical protein